MNNFRKKSYWQRGQQSGQAIDGFIRRPAKPMQPGAPTIQPHVPARPSFSDRVHRPQTASKAQFVSDFRRPVGNEFTVPSKARTVTGPRREAYRTAPSPERQQQSKQTERQPVTNRSTANTRRGRLWLPWRRHKAKKQRPTWQKWALRGSLGTAAVVVVVLGFLITQGYLNLNKILQGGGAAAALDADVDPSKLKGEGDGRVNILLLGRGGEGHDGPDLTDTLLVASVDPVNKKAALLSIPRDLWVKGRNGDSKINAVFANTKNASLNRSLDEAAAEKAGIAAVEDVVEDVLDISIHYYGMIDFRGFEKAVNTLGGVTIDVPEELRDATMAWENNWNPVIARAGKQEMNGKQALMYVRSRHGSTRGDFDRAERQRLFIMALKNEVLSAGTFSNPMKVSRLMSDFGAHTRTDFSLNDLMRLYSLTKDIGKMDSISLVDPPHDFLTTGNFGGQSVVQPKAGLFAYEDVHEYIRGALPDGYIIKEKAPIRLLNGTAVEGMATAEGDKLKSYKYNVVKVDNAPTQDYANTVIVDLSGKHKYTKNYLEKRYKVKATRTIPAGIHIPEAERSGFVIIIGRNETINR